MRKVMLVCCNTEQNGNSKAVFEVASRKQATIVRKRLYSLLPRKCHSSVTAIAWTKQGYMEWRQGISTRIGLPLGPVKWFEIGDALPERFEELQVSPEVMQSFRAELQAALRRKPWYYWCLPNMRELFLYLARYIFSR